MSENEYEDYKLSDEEETEYIEAEEITTYLPVKTENLQVNTENLPANTEDLYVKIEEVRVQNEDLFNHETTYEEEDRPKNTSFESYVYKNTKQQHGFKKWIVRLLKLILFLMCLPFILVMLGGVAGAAMAFLGGGIGLLGGGFILLIGAAFFSSYLGGSLIMLGITSAITLLASGTLVMILFVMVIKKIIKYLKYYCQKRKQNQTAEKEGREA